MPRSAHLCDLLLNFPQFPTSGALTDRPAPHLQPLPQGGHSVAVSTAASLAPQTTRSGRRESAGWEKWSGFRTSLQETTDFTVKCDGFRLTNPLINMKPSD